ncbi:MAG: hypothetical protein CALGDGBN_01294 [Pseudomonadales bacterium]|nr:hypothetical protein [Pseudomonadales bacterium]
MNRIATMRRALRLACAAAALLASAALPAQQLEEVLDAAEAGTAEAQQSQRRIDELAEETRALLEEYRALNRQIEGLDVYNTRLERQITAQEQRIEAIDASLGEVTVLARQMLPLLVRMIDSLESFIALDRPFHLRERRERIAFLRHNMDRPDIALAEKFRQVMDAYRIEIEFGRKIDTYRDTIAVGGEEREVDVLRVGRIALLYRTPDGGACGLWNPQARAWEPLDSGDFDVAIRDGIRIAGRQAALALLPLPVTAPEAAP